MAIAPLQVSASAAAQAYRATNAGAPAISTSGSDFGGMVSQALENAVNTGKDADRQAEAAIKGNGNITDVVAAVSKAELALQTTVAVRDRVVQAYQDIMRMSI